MRRLLRLVDDWIDEHGVDADPGGPDDFEPTRIDDDPELQLDLASGEVATILWATGFHPDYSWMELPVLDHKGRIRHEGGVVTEAPRGLCDRHAIPPSPQVDVHPRRGG